MTARACMGGFCAVRENCKHFNVGWPQRARPIERLCEPATHSAFHTEQHDAFEPQMPRPILGPLIPAAV